MSINNNHYRTAEAEIGNRRFAAERRLSQNEKEISSKYPEIYSIYTSIKSTSSKIVKLIYEHDPDFEEKFSQIQSENLMLRERLKQELVRKGYAPDFLSLVFTCKICNDRGYADGKLCECFKEAVRRAASQELNDSSPLTLSEFKDFSLHYYDDKQADRSGLTPREIMSENLNFCREYAENFHLPYNGIVMRGGTGLGKTHLSLSIANEVIKKGYSVIYGSSFDIFRKAEQEYYGRSDDNIIETLTNVDLLILDDIGAEHEKPVYSSIFYNILNNRINTSRPTIISTNCDLGELKARYGDRIVSRLQSMENLMFTGFDVRIQKSRENL